MAGAAQLQAVPADVDQSVDSGTGADLREPARRAQRGTDERKHHESRTSRRTATSQRSGVVWGATKKTTRASASTPWWNGLATHQPLFQSGRFRPMPGIYE